MRLRPPWHEDSSIVYFVAASVVMGGAIGALLAWVLVAVTR